VASISEVAGDRMESRTTDSSNDGAVIEARWIVGRIIALFAGCAQHAAAE